MNKKSLVLCCCFYLCIQIIDGQLEGEPCLISANQSGVYSTIRGCISILNVLRQENHAVNESEEFTTTRKPITTARISVRKCNEYKEFEYNNKVYLGNVLDSPPIEKKTSNCAFTSDSLGGTKTKQREFPHMDTLMNPDILNLTFITKSGEDLSYFTNRQTFLYHTLCNKFYSNVMSAISLSFKTREMQMIAEMKISVLIGFVYGNSVIWGCGGTLISEQFVLSAAHCIDQTRDSFTSPAKYVRLGNYDLGRTYDSSHIDINIIEIIPHPEYSYPRYYNDIGLFKLERRLQFNSAIRPACLPEQPNVTGKAIATGWGNIDWTANGSNVLLTVILDMFSEGDCNRTYNTYIRNRRLNRGIMEEIQMCAGSKYKKKDTCQEGHSGGPLQIYHPAHFCMYTVVGVTSFGNVCGTFEIPGLYTRVYAYLSWIEGVVWPNEKDL